MAQLSGLDYEGKYNNSTTGLLKDNSTHDIVPSRHRSQVTDTKDSFVNWIDQVVDEDDMASDSAVKVPTQQSVKAYVDAAIDSSFVYNEVPTGTINGSNTAFTVANTPTAGTLMLYSDGLRMTPTTDYSITGTSITMVVAPSTALICDYRK